MAHDELPYDEFGLLHENASEVGLPFDAESPPVVRRVAVDAPSGHHVSALVWGDEAAEVVLLHGGAQNAHTWDTVALALDRPLVAIDLPGHGHSQWRATKDYRPQSIADDIAFVVRTLASDAHTIVGMSLGGLTAVSTLALDGDLVDRIALVDITPGVNQEKASVVTAFIAGPEDFGSFDAILERTIQFNPTRTESSLRRGVLHNAYERDDGTWVWRYDRFTPERVEDVALNLDDLWDAIGSLDHPMLLLKGGDSPVVDDDDLAELRRRKVDVDVVVVDGAGHSIQGDRPLELASELTRFMDAG
jgi:pimeloyl-ACP methyl ester carboxylesterase